MSDIRVFTSKNCPPCQEIHGLLETYQGPEEITVIDIDTDEGFAEFKKEVMISGQGAVPSAFRDGQKCIVTLNENKDSLLFKCPGPDCTEKPPVIDPEISPIESPSD